jgi:hypothetical protein
MDRTKPDQALRSPAVGVLLLAQSGSPLQPSPLPVLVQSSGVRWLRFVVVTRGSRIALAGAMLTIAGMAAISPRAARQRIGTPAGISLSRLFFCLLFALARD